MPTKKQILDAASEYGQAEIYLERAVEYAERREALIATHIAWDKLEKLVTEATDGPF